uniref:Uncharacterized protein n=1 Tax=Anguilla anguilla TaxID=7936 RepID=A0A0E9SG47_ANGAN
MRFGFCWDHRDTLFYFINPHTQAA